MAAIQRKLRNRYERETIKNDVETKLGELKLNDSLQGIVEIKKILADFVESTSKHEFNGKVDMHEAGISITYCFPARRVMKHSLLISKLENTKKESKKDVNSVPPPPRFSGLL